MSAVVAFDGICFGDGPITGVGRSFATALAAYAQTERCILLQPEGIDVPDELADRPLLEVVAAPRGRWQRQRRLPSLLRALQADLLHSSVASVPIRASCPTIATVHDLPWLHPELGETSSTWRRFATARALRSAALILAPSEQTRRDAATLLGRKAAKIVVVPHATPQPAEPTARDETRTGPLLVLGDTRSRKNREALVRSHAAARAERHSSAKAHFEMNGPEIDGLEPSFPDLQFVGPPDNYVSEAEKTELLRTCRALVHVSKFEGFGLPVLEGLAHGAPVLCSDLPPHRDIARDAALFVAPNDERALVDALLQIHIDRSLRQTLIAAGPQRAAAFTPAATARAWRRLHREVLA
ncbi:MAG: glycosyltransferase family 4 protein [Planctomycetota bacterium]